MEVAVLAKVGTDARAEFKAKNKETARRLTDGFVNGDFRHASGVHNDKFLLVNEVPQSAPRRINLDQCQGNRDDANAGARNNRAYGDVEVNVTDARSAVRGAMSPEALRPQIRTQLVVARDALDCNARMRSASVPLPGCSEPTLAPGPPAGP
jgi:hypothetical protein